MKRREEEERVRELLSCYGLFCFGLSFPVFLISSESNLWFGSQLSSWFLSRVQLVGLSWNKICGFGYWELGLTRSFLVVLHVSQLRCHPYYLITKTTGHYGIIQWVGGYGVLVEMASLSQSQSGGGPMAPAKSSSRFVTIMGTILVMAGQMVILYLKVCKGYLMVSISIMRTSNIMIYGFEVFGTLGFYLCFGYNSSKGLFHYEGIWFSDQDGLVITGGGIYGSHAHVYGFKESGIATDDWPTYMELVKNFFGLMVHNIYDVWVSLYPTDFCSKKSLIF